MTDAIQAISGIYAAAAPQTVGPIYQWLQTAPVLNVLPNSLGNLIATAPTTVTYNAAALIESLMEASIRAQEAAAPTAVPVTAAATPVNSASAFSAADIIAQLSSSIATPSINSTNLGLAAATLLDSSGLPATTTAIDSGGKPITTMTPSTAPSPIDSHPEINAVLLASNTSPTSSAPAATATVAATPTVAQPPIVEKPAVAAADEAVVVTPGLDVPVPASTQPIETAAVVEPDIASSTAAETSTMANTFLLDSINQALANIGGNPTYANTVAGLYLSAAIFHAQQPAGITLSHAADSVLPVSAISRITPVQFARR